MSIGRTLLVSNRLPITMRNERARLVVSKSTGGLATGLRGPHERGGGMWIGWPGDVSKMTPPMLAEMAQKLEELRCAPVDLTPSEVARYYDGFSNAVLWPLFHYELDRIPVGEQDWDVYRHVNEKFADVVAKIYQPGDAVWVHDYQLMLVPSLLRERIPSAKIGFFLHIPFPASEVLRTLPWREEILEGVLGSDLIGFHTHTYKKHFASSVERVLGATVRGDVVQRGARKSTIGVFPMGVDVAHWKKLGEQEVVQDETAAIRTEAKKETILLGVDRLDYTKGIVRRLAAFERLLQKWPAMRERVRMVLLLVPSRDRVESYQEYRRAVNEHISRINGAHATLTWTPIHYVHRPFSEHHLVALYRAADVMLVTPLRDGMNLVAKEFVASRGADDGVLVLSEFAGAAAEMGEAVIVNPYDVESLAEAYYRAITMPEEEKRYRMHALRKRVEASDVHGWAQGFIDALDGVTSDAKEGAATTGNEPLGAALERVKSADKLSILLDYDGTLVPFAVAPDLAAPDAALIDLLRALSQRRGTEVHIVSGRRRETLERWLGDLPIGLHAEHGFWSRSRPAPGETAAWRSARELDAPWKTELRALLERFTSSTPGSLVEEKSASIAWHYRLVEPELAAQRAQEVASAIEAAIRDRPLEILPGEKVIEVRQRGVTKGLVATAIRDSGVSGAILAIGDDVTDDELFRALPPDATTISVGERAQGAKSRVADSDAVRALLVKLLGE